MDSQNYWNGIERRKPSGELEAAYDTAAKTQARQLAVIEELREQVKQQAAVIERLQEYVKRTTEWKQGNPAFEWVAALQPCPEVLNKVRADAVREVASKLDISYTTGKAFAYWLNAQAQRIEQGEA